MKHSKNWKHPKRRKAVYEHLGLRMMAGLAGNQRKTEAFERRIVEYENSIGAKYREGSNEIKHGLAVDECDVDEQGNLIESPRLAGFTEAEEHERDTRQHITRLRRAAAVHHDMTKDKERLAKETLLEAAQAKLEIAAIEGVNIHRELVRLWNELIAAIDRLNQARGAYEDVLQSEYYPRWRDVGERRPNFAGDTMNCCRAALPQYASQPIHETAYQEWAMRASMFLKNPNARDPYTGVPAQLTDTAFLSESWNNFSPDQIQNLVEGKAPDGQADPFADEPVVFDEAEDEEVTSEADTEIESERASETQDDAEAESSRSENPESN